MTLLQAVIAIIVAIVGSTGTTLGFVQFLIKRKDEKEENSVHKQIDEAIKEAKTEVYEKLTEGLFQRGEEGRERFEINSKQIEKNTTQIGEILTIVRKQTEQYDAMVQSLTTLNASVSTLNTQFGACAEGVNSNLYDKISIVAKKALKRKAITTTEKTNLRQLWESYTKLGGSDETLKTYYEECGKLETINDDEA